MRYQELSPDGVQLAQTESGRQFLTYLASCALLPDQGTYAVVEGKRYEFPGGLGLAPEWLDRPMTEIEQRWVSAGMLARTNFFGKAVPISLRNPHSGFDSLNVSAGEAEEFSIYEGDFFGNIFAEPSIACVAAAPRMSGQADDPVFALRVGTEVDPAMGLILGMAITRCGFVLTGAPHEPKAHHFDQVEYPQYISVYLKSQKT